MSLATLFSRARSGINAPLVTIEVHLANGLPSLSIVGLPEMAVRESKDRVRGAIINSRFEFPTRRITINLAPADLPKEGGRFDLPIALGILAASGQIPMQSLEKYEFIGELALSGTLRPVQGSLPVALAARKAKRRLILPSESAPEACLVSRVDILAAKHLLEVCNHLTDTPSLSPQQYCLPVANREHYPDLAEIKGQPHAKRALEIAASGGHSLLMIGPPGTGKSMLANRLPGIMPVMTEAEALEIAAVCSISHAGFSPDQWMQRPFRSPHHTASGVALVGGGSNPRPGEISLAHNGVMFLDELPEFDRKVLEVLREPLENGFITISRANRQEQFPARFQLIAAMNPCPCGYRGEHNGKTCRCSQDQVTRYIGRISGPLLDRIDMHIELPRLAASILSTPPAQPPASSQQIRQRVDQCRQRQLSRSGMPNALLSGQRLEQCCQLSAGSQQLLHRAIDRLHLSARAYHRILRLARTIADLAASEQIADHHLTEAIGYRALDRQAD